jgi:hypothetical protein
MVKSHTLLHGVPTIHNEQGDIDLSELLDLFQITQSQLARILSISRQLLNQSPYSDTVQRGSRRLEYLFARLRNLTGSPRNARIWLKMAHPDFEGVAPLELLEQGHIEAVEDLILAIETGQPR